MPKTGARFYKLPEENSISSATGGGWNLMKTQIQYNHLKVDGILQREKRQI